MKIKKWPAKIKKWLKECPVKIKEWVKTHRVLFCIGLSLIIFGLILLVFFLDLTGSVTEAKNLLGLLAIIAIPFFVLQVILKGETTKAQTKDANTQLQSVHTTSYFKALEVLKDEDLIMRAGAINELGKIAHESQVHHLQIIKLLCSYLQEKIPRKKEKEEKPKEEKPRVDIQAILDVFGNRKWIDDVEKEDNYQLDMSSLSLKRYRFKGNFKRADLRGAHLEEAYLEGAYLERANLFMAHLIGAHLEKAHLEGAHLEGAHLERAHLEGAHLIGAHLEGADLEGANLRGAHLRGAHLRGADLIGANLEGADLEGANLEGANLRGANLEGAENLTQKQISVTIGNDKTKIPSNLKRPEHWKLSFEEQIISILKNKD